jgi:hypothetical protein
MNYIDTLQDQDKPKNVDITLLKCHQKSELMDMFNYHKTHTMI